MYIYIRQKLSMQAVIEKERIADISTDIRDSNPLISIFTLHSEALDLLQI